MSPIRVASVFLLCLAAAIAQQATTSGEMYGNVPGFKVEVTGDHEITVTSPDGTKLLESVSLLPLGRAIVARSIPENSIERMRIEVYGVDELGNSGERTVADVSTGAEVWNQGVDRYLAAGPGEGGLFDPKTGDFAFAASNAPSRIFVLLPSSGPGLAHNQEGKGRQNGAVVFSDPNVVRQGIGNPQADRWWGICHGAAPGVVEIVLLPGPADPEALRDLFEEEMLSADVFAEKIGSDHLQKKHIGNVKYANIVLFVGGAATGGEVRDIREMTTGTDVEYRVYGPGDAHYGSGTFK